MYIYIDTYMYVGQKSCLQYAHQYAKHFKKFRKFNLAFNTDNQVNLLNKKNKKIGHLAFNVHERMHTPNLKQYINTKQNSDLRIHTSHELYA